MAHSNMERTQEVLSLQMPKIQNGLEGDGCPYLEVLVIAGLHWFTWVAWWWPLPVVAHMSGWLPLGRVGVLLPVWMAHLSRKWKVSGWWSTMHMVAMATRVL